MAKLTLTQADIESDRIFTEEELGEVTNAQLQELLVARGAEYESDANKARLIELVLETQKPVGSDEVVVDASAGEAEIEEKPKILYEKIQTSIGVKYKRAGTMHGHIDDLPTLDEI